MDGYRTHGRLHRSATHSGALDAGQVQLLTHRGNIWTDKYSAIAKEIAGLPAKDAYLNGELCGVLPDGRTTFNPALSSRHTRLPDATRWQRP
jgi:ATP-dependent DNA ligase